MNKTERNLEDMLNYVLSRENPVHISITTNPKFHHILTQDLLSENVHLGVLNVRQMGKELYEQFPKERFIVTKWHPISRTSLKTFKVLQVIRKPEDKTAANRFYSSSKGPLILLALEIMILTDCSNTI